MYFTVKFKGSDNFCLIEADKKPIVGRIDEFNGKMIAFNRDGTHAELFGNINMEEINFCSEISRIAFDEMITKTKESIRRQI